MRLLESLKWDGGRLELLNHRRGERATNAHGLVMRRREASPERRAAPIALVEAPLIRDPPDLVAILGLRLF
jgi:hypothetical protein